MEAVMVSRDEKKKHARRSPLQLYTSGERGCALCAALGFCVLIYFNFRTGALSSEIDRPPTPDQTYQPTYPDDGSASFGIILAANGPFVEKAFISARALGRGANATLFSDVTGSVVCERLKADALRRPGDVVRDIDLRCAVARPNVTIDAWGFRAAKLWAFTATPYDKTLYLDADAFPCASFEWLRSELSPALERYDVMATHSSMRRGFAHALHWLNAGVIAFDARSPAARAVFRHWLENYEKQHAKTDQRIFNEAARDRVAGRRAETQSAARLGQSSEPRQRPRRRQGALVAACETCDPGASHLVARSHRRRRSSRATRAPWRCRPSSTASESPSPRGGSFVGPCRGWGVVRRLARHPETVPEHRTRSNYKSVRYGWAKAVSPYLYRKVRKDWPCCEIESVGKCVVDHECRFPALGSQKPSKRRGEPKSARAARA